jgi:hypothetical protein
MSDILRQSPSKLAGCLQQITEKGLDQSALVLFFDQMETIFAGPDQGAVDAFLAALSEAAGQGLW